EEDYKVYYKILTSFGFHFSLNLLKSAFDKARTIWIAKQQKGEIWNEERMLELVKDMLSFIGISDEELAIKVINLWSENVNFKVYDDVVETLDELTKNKYKLIVISNVSSEKNLKIYLSRCGLQKYFSHLVASGTVGIEKPNKEIFLLASRILGVKAHRILHVGDNYESDYIGAKNAGLKAILLDRLGKHSGKDALMIKSLSELIEVLNL
ncbi:MAG: HAD-IA family hydrolase, partial [Candidatus Brockarchaeota archaeon]|nr:HAD-IA family hydrolase [Candidatus Brockarchaeota archaeon]